MLAAHSRFCLMTVSLAVLSIMSLGCSDQGFKTVSAETYSKPVFDSGGSDTLAPMVFTDETTKGFCTTSQTFAPTPLSLQLPAKSPSLNTALVVLNIGAIASAGSCTGSPGVLALFSTAIAAPFARAFFANVAGSATLVGILHLTSASQIVSARMEAQAGSGTPRVGFAKGFTASLTATLINCISKVGNCE